MSARRAPFAVVDLDGAPGFAVSAVHPLGSDLARLAAALSAGDLALARDLADGLFVTASRMERRPIEAEALFSRADCMDAALRRLKL